MENAKVMLYKIEQLTKVRAIKKANDISLDQNKFFTRDKVSIYTRMVDSKGKSFMKKQLTGIVLRGNTHKKFNFKGELNVNTYGNFSKLGETIGVGFIPSSDNRISMDVDVNDPNIYIEHVESAKRTNGVKVLGCGRQNLRKQFMDKNINVKRLKKMFKNTI